MNKLTDFDMQVLRMLNGDIELPWGAAVSVALEWLSGQGLASDRLPYRITEAGRTLLSTTKDEG